MNATGGHATSDWSARRVAIDSRTAQPGDLFVALKGPHFDGHDFIAGALKGGAAAAVVHRMPENLSSDAPLLLVNDTMTALEALGQAARARTKAKFVAVTGSVGKTSTKEALRLALATAGSTYATTGNLNNQWGVPLSLANMPRGSRFGVFELGMNHAGEIGPLSKQVRPEIAIVTNGRAGASGVLRVGRSDRRRQGGDLRGHGRRTASPSSTATTSISTGSPITPAATASAASSASAVMQKRRRA